MQPGASYMLVTPEGDELFGRDGGEGGIEYYDPEGLSWKPLDFPARKVSITGSGAEAKSGLTLSNENKYDKEFSDAFSQARVMMTQTNAALKLIEGDPAAMNVAGAVVRMIDSFTSNVKSIVDLVAEKDPALDFQVLKDDLTMFDTFDKLAIKNATYRSSMLDLGYSYAATLGGAGVGQRVTEADLRNAMKIIGGQAGSPQQLVGVISFIQERALVRLESEAAAQNRYLRNEDNKIVFDRSMLPERYVPSWAEPDTESGMDMTNATPEELKLFQELEGLGILK